ncbi:phosphotransferase family protein [Streptomyces sp. NPDC004436]
MRYSLKRHCGARFHGREVTAYRSWVAALGPRAPRLVAADSAAQAIVVTALSGRPMHGAALDPADEARLQHGLGRFVGALHRSTPETPAEGATAGDKIKRHLEGARPCLADGGQDLVLALARTYAGLPRRVFVPTGGDLQYRNVLIGDDGEVLLFDFERSEYSTPTRDMVRLSDTWTGRPDLRNAFLDGYGRLLTPVEELRLDCEAAFDVVSGIAYGTVHGDPEVTERGHRTLRRLHTVHSSWPGHLRCLSWKASLVSEPRLATPADAAEIARPPVLGEHPQRTPRRDLARHVRGPARLTPSGRRRRPRLRGRLPHRGGSPPAPWARSTLCFRPRSIPRGWPYGSTLSPLTPLTGVTATPRRARRASRPSGT